MVAKEHWYWIAYTDRIQAVKLVRRGTGGHKLHTEMESPMVVISEEGHEFVMEKADLHDNPVQAHLAAIELAKKHGVPAPEFEGSPSDYMDEEEEEEDEDEGEEDGEDYDDDDDEEGDLEEEGGEEYEDEEEAED